MMTQEDENHEDGEDDNYDDDDIDDGDDDDDNDDDDDIDDDDDDDDDDDGCYTENEDNHDDDDVRHSLLCMFCLDICQTFVRQPENISHACGLCDLSSALDICPTDKCACVQICNFAIVH